MVVKLKRMWVRHWRMLIAFVAEKSDFGLIEELWGSNVKNFFWLKPSSEAKLEVYYNEEELDDMYSWVLEQIKSNPEFVPLVKKRFLTHLNTLMPYLNGKEINSFSELKEYYNNFLNFYSPLDSVFLIPTFEETPQHVKDELLAIREKTQHLTEELDRPMVEFLEKNKGKYKDVLDVLSGEEMLMLEHRDFTPEEYTKILQRKIGCAIFRGKVYSLDEIPLLLEKNGLAIVEDECGEKEEIPGMCANKGKAIGRALIITGKGDYAKVDSQTIIVTEMTMPTMTHIMARAAAIVTDEGGVTCHAAIISRELNIPCVVGTKNASRILKSGELIEVDADKGLVKRLANVTN